MKAIFKLHFNCGRQGTLHGVFIAEKEDIDILLANEDIEIDFGEALGKHSDVWGNLVLKDITFVTDNKEIIELFEKHNLSTGYNPIYRMVTYTTCQKYFTDEDEASVKEVIEFIKNKEKNNENRLD